MQIQKRTNIENYIIYTEMFISEVTKKLYSGCSWCYFLKDIILLTDFNVSLFLSPPSKMKKYKIII
jgi:hypothetical protein